MSFVTFLVFALALEAPLPRLRHVTTARQMGPVGHRDPIGVLSPDGKWLAYSEGRFLRLIRVEGGPVRELEPLETDIREIVWSRDSLRLAVPERAVGATPARWYFYDIEDGRRELSWPIATELSQLSITPDGRDFVGVARNGSEFSLVRRSVEGDDAALTTSPNRLSFPLTRSSGEVACLVWSEGRQRLSMNCGEPKARWLTDAEAYGPFAFSPDGGTVYYASPSEGGTLDVFSHNLADDRRVRLTGFARDAYAPSVDAQGRILFKVQDYRVFVAMAPSAGGPTTPLTTFMAETPSFDFSGKQIGFTFGNWRRAVDDYHYPDIAQHVGLVHLDSPLPAEAPHGIVSSSPSEDQGQSFSPNGKWIAFHSHFEASDDIWIVPSDGSKSPRRLTRGGYETAWPRWSPDGRWIAYSTAKGREASSRTYLLRMDEETGEMLEPEREVALRDFDAEVIHAEWKPDADELFFEAFLGPGRKAIYRVARDGGRPRRIHEFASEDKFSGIAASPDGRWIVYVAPGPSGHQQVFRLPSNGGTPMRVTSDPTNKTHPAYSPDGEQIAFTVWRYEAQFWLLSPGEP